VTYTRDGGRRYRRPRPVHLSNTATATAPGGVTTRHRANNTATDSDYLSPSANLGITKTDGRSQAQRRAGDGDIIR